MTPASAPRRNVGTSAPDRAFQRVRHDLKANGRADHGGAERRAHERRLLAAAREGDPRATRELLDGVSPTVYRFGRSFCRDPHDAEDVMQDVFAALSRSLDTFRGDASITSWAYVVAQRACARRRRRPKAAPSLTSLDREEGGPVEVADERADPARIAEASELRQVLEDAIRELPGPQRDVLMLRDVEGISAREVGHALGLGERAVKSRLHRARLAVRRRVAAYRDGVLAPRPSGCPDTPALLSRFLEGEIGAADCAAIERHVASCNWCRGACTALRDSLRACRRWGAAPVPRAMRSRLRRAVRAVVSAGGGAAARAGGRRRASRTRRDAG